MTSPRQPKADKSLPPRGGSGAPPKSAGLSAAHREAGVRMNKARTIVGRRSAEDRGDELYETPIEAVRALCRADAWLMAQKRTLWDPACGPGAIVEALCLEGHVPMASDLRDYEDRWRGPDWVVRDWGRDFLRFGRVRARVGDVPASAAEAIVMNPPFSRGDDFLPQALVLAPRVYALLELGWMQGESLARDMLIDGGHLRALYPFRERLDMNADGWDGNDARSTRKHAWFVFSRDAQAGSRASRDEPGSGHAGFASAPAAHEAGSGLRFQRLSLKRMEGLDD